MTSIPNTYNGYDIDTAARLLGPADYTAPDAPQTCLDLIINAIVLIWKTIARVFNLIFGDHRWYDNSIACNICIAAERDDAITPAVQGALDQLKLQLQTRAHAPNCSSNGPISLADFVNTLTYYENFRTRDLFTRMPRAGWQQLILDVERAPHATPEEIEAFNLGQWDHPIFSTDKWIATAFKAYFANSIDEERLTLLSIYDEAQRLHPGEVRAHQLANDQTLNMLLSGTRLILNEPAADVFRNRLPHLTPQQTQFFTVPLHNFPAAGTPTSDLIAFAYHNLRFTFGLIVQNGQASLLVIPPALMYHILQARFGEDAIQPNCVFGFADVEDFLSIYNRIVYLPSRYDPAPAQVHNLDCSSLGVYLHDCYYHLGVESAIPLIQRELWCQVAEEFRTQGLNNTREFLLDRDLKDYLLVNNRSANEQFEHALNQLITDFQFHETENAQNRDNPAHKIVVDDGSAAILQRYR